MAIDVKIEQSWKELLAPEWEESYFEKLTGRVRDSYRNGTVYPAPGRIFAAFNATPVDRVKVVIVGQDPYHGPGQANGLCFSVNSGVELPPSLRNIYREIAAETGVQPIPDGDLSRWARQGVLLLNSILTVEQAKAGSHHGMGWEEFTSAAIERLASSTQGLVFMLWGSYAINKGAAIDRQRHLVLTSAHPSPLSAHRGFFGNGHFVKANEYLESIGKEPIDWR